jgi:hypothetical protein
MYQTRVRAGRHPTLARCFLGAPLVRWFLPTIDPSQSVLAECFVSFSFEILCHRVGHDLLSMLVDPVLQFVHQVYQFRKAGLVAVRHRFATHEAEHPAHLGVLAWLPRGCEIQGRQSVWHPVELFVYPCVRFVNPGASRFSRRSLEAEGAVPLQQPHMVGPCQPPHACVFVRRGAAFVCRSCRIYLTLFRFIQEFSGIFRDFR